MEALSGILGRFRAICDELTTFLGELNEVQDNPGKVETFYDVS